ncbi:MAG: winged helix-turn-helix transcriptional regulator [Methanobacteriaceae archaeon]|jgi:putative transcriptional regulator
MKIFKKKGELTRFQILAEIAKTRPHLRQKDIAEKLGISIQAISENIKSLTDDGFVEIRGDTVRYHITKRGIEKLKKEAVNLRKYADEVSEIMNTYKSVWPAIAKEELVKGEKVWLIMENGVLYAIKHETPASAEVIQNAKKGEDVALTNLKGTIELKTGDVTIIRLPTANKGGSRVSDLDKINEIYKRGFDRVGVMGTISRVVADKLTISPDFEFAIPHATVAASKKGLNVLVFAVGKMTNSITSKLEKEGIHYIIEDVEK